ncbi:MAG: hypothetical protein ACR2PL_22610 [Dehalococcoidia bacterium]
MGTHLDIEMLTASGAKILPPLVADMPLPAIRTGRAVAGELHGRLLLTDLLRRDASRYNAGRSTQTYATFTPYTGAEAIRYLLLPGALSPRSHFLFLDPERIDQILGPMWAADAHWSLPIMEEEGLGVNEILDGEIRDAVSRIFAQFCTLHNLRIMTSAIDKYGSTVWEAGKVADLNRYLTLGFTPIDVIDLPIDLRTAKVMSHIEKKRVDEVLLAEISIGADNSVRVTHRMETCWLSIVREEIELDIRNGVLGKRLITALEKVQTITEDELTESYIIPRVQQTA